MNDAKIIFVGKCEHYAQCPQSLARLAAGGSSLSAVVVVVVVIIWVGQGVGER